MPPRDDPPITTIILNGQEGDNGWYVSAVSISFNVTDDNPWFGTTYYKLDDGAWQIYLGPPLVIGEDGRYTISYYSVDNAGNSETPKQQPLNIDQTCPLILNLKHISLTEIAFGADVSDAMSGVNRVQFYINGNLAKVDSIAPYLYIMHFGIPHFKWMHLNITVSAVVYDNAGNSCWVEDGIPPDITHVKGIINHLVVSNSSITFRAVITMYDPAGFWPPRLMLPRTFTYSNYDGEVSLHWIDIYLF